MNASHIPTASVTQRQYRCGFAELLFRHPFGLALSARQPKAPDGPQTVPGGLVGAPSLNRSTKTKQAAELDLRPANGLETSVGLTGFEPATP